MNRKMIKTVLKSMFAKNIANIFIIMGISIYVILPMVLTSSSESMLSTVKDNRSNVYGDFSDIYYDYDVTKKDDDVLLEQEYIDKIVGEMECEEYGILNIVAQLDIENIKYNIGWCDDAALKLGRIKLIEGKMPVSSTELALTEETLDVLGRDVTIGDNIEVAGKEYTITGILANYGRLWPKGEKQTENKATDIDIFVNEDEALKIYKSAGFISYVVLIDRNTEIASNIQYGENYYYNTNGQLGEDSRLFYVPDGFITIVVVVCTFLLFNILFMVRNKIDEKYAILWRLGLSKRKCRLYLSLEMFVNALIGNILGIALGMLGTKVSIGILEKQLSSAIIIKYDIKTILLMILIDTFIVIIIGNIFYGIKNDKNGLRLRIHKPKRNGIYRLAFVEFKKSKKIFITMVFMLASSISFVYYINQFNKTFVDSNEYEEVEGKMPINYDYELYTEPINTTPMDDGDVCIVDTYERDGANEETLKNILGLDGVKSAYGYKENNKIYILEESEAFSTYLDLTDYFIDGVYDNRMYVSQGLSDIVGYGDNTVIRTKIMGYPEEDIFEFGKYVVEGKIDIDKINSGEEIILVVPAYRNTVETYSDGSMGSFLEPVAYDEVGAINDTLYHVGDKVLLSELKLLTDINGGLSEDEVKANIRRTDVTVRIGAIIRSNVGWFEKETEVGATYKFITTNKGLESYGVDATYNRIRIYASESADVEILSNQIASIAIDYPRMSLDNMTNQLKNYRELNYLLSLICKLLMVMVLVIGVITIVSQMISKSRIHNEYYRLYRMNGMHFIEVVFMFFVQIVIVVLVSFALMLPMTYIIFCGVGVTSVAAYIKLISSAKMIRVICAYIGAVIVMCTVLSGVCVKREE